MTFDEMLFVATRKDISLFKTNDDYMKYSIELYKEFFTFFCATLKLNEMCEKYLDREKAILFGLLRKLEDISLNYLNILCNGSMDSSQILIRTSKEILVTILVMLENYNDKEIFSDYIKYSLLTEKKYYQKLLVDDADPDRQGEIKTLRERMKASIESSFHNAGIKVEQLDIGFEQKNNFWCKTNIYNRFKMAGISSLYDSYRLDCHAIHGNWQNLNQNFIEHESQGITINYEKRIAKPQCVLPFIILHGFALSKIIDYFISNCELKESLNKHMAFCLDEVAEVDIAHEKYLVSNQNTTY